jgi:serine/threonine protein kinase
MKKYAVQKKYQAFPVDLLKQVAKKILLALQFIHSKGLSHGHLHTGNILYDPATNNIKLTDLVNSLLGVPYFYRAYIVEHKKIQVI